jgi:hypothetical protein
MCPVTFTSLSQMLDLDCGNGKKVVPYLRCHELSLIQRLITILLADSDANTEVN